MAAFAAIRSSGSSAGEAPPWRSGAPALSRPRVVRGRHTSGPRADPTACCATRSPAIAGSGLQSSASTRATRGCRRSCRRGYARPAGTLNGITKLISLPRAFAVRSLEAAAHASGRVLSIRRFTFAGDQRAVSPRRPSRCYGCLVGNRAGAAMGLGMRIPVCAAQHSEARFDERAGRWAPVHRRPPPARRSSAR